MPKFAASSRSWALPCAAAAPEELGAMTRDQLAKYARVIKQMGIANE